jgi:O-antigen/teichoic acid export membrane protein
MGDADQKALNALAKGAGITAIGMAVSKVLTYLYRVVIARGVGPDAYGQLSLALMVIGISTTIAYLSLGSGLKKFIPEFRTKDDDASIRGIVLNALELTIPLSLVLFLMVFSGAEFISKTVFENEELIPLIKILSFTIPIGQVSSVFLDTTVAFNKIIYKTVTVRIIQNIVQLTVTIALLILGFEVASAAWGWIAGATLSLILGFYFMERKIGPILFSDVKPKYHRKKILRFSAPLLLSGMIGTVMGWADTGLLGYYMTDFEVGLYNAALPTALLILLPHKAIGSLSVTSFSELKERNEQGVEDSLKTATYWVYSLVFPTFLVLLLFSDQVLKLLWGGQYTQASAALSILAGGYLIDAMAGRIGSILKSKGHTRYILYNNSLALTLNLALNIYLIPIYGIIGAAIATASSTILTNLLMFIEVWRKEKIISIPKKKIAKITAVGLVPLALISSLDSILFVNTPFWFIFPAGILYYGLYAVIFLKVLGLGEEERQVFLRIGEILDREELVESVIERLEGK